MSGLLLLPYIYIFFCNPVHSVHATDVTEAGDANGSAGVLWPSPSQGREWRGRPTSAPFSSDPVVRHYQSVHGYIYIYFSFFFSLSSDCERLEELGGSESSRVFRLSAKYLNWAPPAFDLPHRRCNPKPLDPALGFLSLSLSPTVWISSDPTSIRFAACLDPADRHSST